MKFILTRHASTEWNRTARIQGHTDIPLDPPGEAEAAQLAGLFSGLGIQLIVSSDLKRARKTAEIINFQLGVPLRLEKELRECAFGEVEGLTRQQAIEKYGNSMGPNWEDQSATYDFRPFGGENRDTVLARHMKVLRSLAKENGSGAVLLVGHGRGLSTLLAGLGQSPILKRGEYRVVEYNT